MTTAEQAGQQAGEQGVALIVGGGPGISASCVRLFADNGMTVAIAARNADKRALVDLEQTHGVQRYACDASDEASVAGLFEQVVKEHGAPTLVVHNIDGRFEGIFRNPISEVDPKNAFRVLQNSAFSAFLVGQQAAKYMLSNEPGANGARGTIIFTNASGAIKGYAQSGAFAMACHAKAGLAESMARELMPQGIHVVTVPIDGAVGWTREDGKRAHWLAGESVDDNTLDPDAIADTYFNLHRQHRSAWTSEVVLRPWLETW
ncbi:MAG: SDR family oxidoreductase [Halieaceae bacterium]